MRRLGLALVLAAIAYGCDSLLVEPAPLNEVEVALAITGPDAPEYGDLSPGLAAVTSVRFHFVHEGGTRDTVFEARPRADQLFVRVGLRAEETVGWLEIEAALLMEGEEGPEPLFRGLGLVDGFEIVPTVSIELRPVASRIDIPYVPPLTSLGDTVQLPAIVRFANDSIIEGAPVAWESEDPTVLEVLAGGRIVSRSNGAATLVARSLEAVSERDIGVRQTPVQMHGIGPADTTVTVGATYQARLFGLDANGYPLLPGANVQWSGTGAVSTYGDGTVTANSAGMGTVSARYSFSVYTAQVTVLP